MLEKRVIAVRASLVSIAGNFLLVLIKGITGILGNSFALIADAIESLTDVVSSFIVFLGLKYASRNPDENHPYGHGRAEPLITFVVVGFLLVSATIIMIQSIKNLSTPQTAPEAYTLWILGGIILIKEGFYRFISRKSKETKSSSLKADAWHHRSDAITSLMAFIGILISITFGQGFEKAEDLAAIVASIVIIYNAYLIFRPALSEVMDEDIHDDFIREIRAHSIQTPGVIDTEKCRVRKSGMDYFIDLHVIVPSEISVKEGHLIGHNLKDSLIHRFPQIRDVLIHIEPDR